VDAGALVLVAMLVATCGGSSGSGPSDGGTGLSSTGSGFTGSTGSSSTGTTTGTGGGAGFDGVWKRASASVTVIDTMAPLAGMGPKEVQIPATTPLPADGREADLYQQISNDKLITYAYLAGDPGYFRIEQPLTQSGDTYLLAVGTNQQTYKMDKGHLAATVVLLLGTMLVTSEATFVKYDGAFPPSTWPTAVLELP
jgi:hypothetical protein